MGLKEMSSVFVSLTSFEMSITEYNLKASDTDGNAESVVRRWSTLPFIPVLKPFLLLGMVVHTFNPSTWEFESSRFSC